MNNESLKQACKESLLVICKLLLGYKDVTLSTHDEIIDCLESEHKRKIVCVPRGSLKSSIACVAFPIWLLINNPNARILIDSELYTNSATFLREIKQHLENPILTELFGEFKLSTCWNESEIIIKQRTKVLKEASITVGGIGTTKVGQHYDYIIGDDYNSPKNSNTPEAAAKVVQHYKLNTSILETTGTYVVIGTRYSESDLIGHILKNEIGLTDDNYTSAIHDVG